MRCRFASLPECSAEARAREAFEEGCRRFFSQLLEDASSAALEERLREVDDDLELLGVSQLGSELRVDVRGDPPHRPRLERLRRAAPRGVDVVIERGPRPFAAAARELEALTGVPVGQAKVRAGITRGHLLDLLVYLPRASSNRFSAEAVAELAVDACLGERRVDDWIHTIRAQPLVGSGPLKLLQAPEEQGHSFPLADLQAAVDCAVAGVTAQLPELPLCQSRPNDDWVILETEPSVCTPGARQTDLVMASTCLPEMLKCFLQDAPFSSLRFSKHDERFAYLKYEDQGTAQARVHARQRLEDDVDRRLRQAGLGCLIGNGVGTRHSYIDVALLDVDRGLDVLTKAARGAGLPTASWILFCDSEWWLEWVGVWPETPEPPLASA